MKLGQSDNLFAVGMFTVSGVAFCNTFYFMDSHLTVLQDRKLGAGTGSPPGMQTVEDNTAVFSPEFTGQRAQITFLTTPLTLNKLSAPNTWLHVTTMYFNVH